jgi:hypothetical protein
MIAGMLGVSAVLTGCALEIDPFPDPADGTPGLVGLPDAHPDATRAYLATLHFTGGAKRSVVNCHATATPVNIDIYPETRSHHVDPVQAALKGRIMARIVNAGPSACPDLGLAVGDTAYWWMGANRGFPLTTDFYRIPGIGAVTHLAKTGQTLVFSDSARTYPDARISTYPAHPGDGDGDGGFDRRLFGHNSSWIACLGGCCESAGVEAIL